MVIGVRQAALRILETDELSHTTEPRVYTKCCETQQKILSGFGFVKS